MIAKLFLLFVLTLIIIWVACVPFMPGVDTFVEWLYASIFGIGGIYIFLFIPITIALGEWQNSYENKIKG